jgi:hypothetical protein
MANSSGRLFASTYNDIMTSTDNGNLWEHYHNGLGDGYPAWDFLIEGNSIYASGYGVYYSSDNGANWIRYTSGLPPSPIVRSITRKGSKLFAATFNGVYYSEDNGLNWNVAGIGLNDYKLWCIVTSGDNILAGTDTSGIFISTDDGSTWSKLQNDFANAQVRFLATYGNFVLAGFGFGWGIFISSDNGFTWTDKGQGFAPLYTFVLDVTGNSTYLFAAGGVTGFYRRPLSDLGITSLDQTSLATPEKFLLSQNYPNPFNPSTKISWQLPTGIHQTLKIYDVLGNEVATLVDEYREAGSYEVEFNAGNLSSGIYFYKFQAGSFIETKKMILLK